MDRLRSPLSYQRSLKSALRAIRNVIYPLHKHNYLANSLRE